MELLITNYATPPRVLASNQQVNFLCHCSLNIYHASGTELINNGENMDEWGIFSSLKKVILMRKTDST